MSKERDEMLFRRKALTNISKAPSVLPMQRLCNMSPLILLEFDAETSAETVDYLLGKIIKSESLGGADMLGRVIGKTEAVGALLVIGASSERLLLEADEKLLFRRKTGCCSQGLHFKSTYDLREGTPNPTQGLCCMLSSAEAVNLIHRILTQLTVGEGEGDKGISMPPGESVIVNLCRHGIITDFYPLHDHQQLSHLWQIWKASWGGLKTDQRHLLEKIKGYFGEGVAHYFGFLGFLINALALKSLLTVILYNIPICYGWSFMFVTFSNEIWSRLFLQGWKQRSESLDADWGHQSKSFASRKGDTPVKQSRFQQSVIFLITMFLLSTTIVLAYFHMGTIIRNQTSTITQGLDYLPEILLTTTMVGLDHVALQLAQSLGVKLQHQEASFQPLLPELVLACIYNHFAVHFYWALVERDLSCLWHHLVVQLATQFALRLLTGAVLPYLRWKWMRTHYKYQDRLEQIQDQSSRPTRNPIETEGHLNILIAYCHVVFFSGISPYCTLWCLLGAVAQSHIDFWQMCTLDRRPFPQATSGIRHTWRCVFDTVDMLSLLANALLMWALSDFQHLGLSQWEMLKVLLVLQLLLMGLKMAVVSATNRIFSKPPPAERPRLRHLRQHRLYRQ